MLHFAASDGGFTRRSPAKRGVGGYRIPVLPQVSNLLKGVRLPLPAPLLRPDGHRDFADKRPRSQAVRRESAKLSYAGSIPAVASSQIDWLTEKNKLS